MHGNGIFATPTVTINGSFVLGELDGDAHFAYTDGRSWKGLFKQGAPWVGSGTYIDSKWVEKTGEWKNGVFSFNAGADKVHSAPAPASATSADFSGNVSQQGDIYQILQGMLGIPFSLRKMGH